MIWIPALAGQNMKKIKRDLMEEPSNKPDHQHPLLNTEKKLKYGEYFTP